VDTLGDESQRQLRYDYTTYLRHMPSPLASS